MVESWGGGEHLTELSLESQALQSRHGEVKTPGPALKKQHFVTAV